MKISCFLYNKRITFFIKKIYEVLGKEYMNHMRKKMTQDQQLAELVEIFKNDSGV